VALVVFHRPAPLTPDPRAAGSVSVANCDHDPSEIDHLQHCRWKKNGAHGPFMIMTIEISPRFEVVDTDPFAGFI